jgi:hypothetical protein
MFRLLYFIIRLFTFLIRYLYMQSVCCVYIRGLSRECGMIMICAISILHFLFTTITLSILNVFLWSSTSTYICIYATLSLNVCRCFVFSTARVEFVFVLIGPVLSFIALVIRFFLHGSWLLCYPPAGYFAHYWGICCYINMRGRIMRLLLTICYVARWFLLFTSLPFLCNPFFVVSSSFTTLLRPCTLVFLHYVRFL